MIKHPEASYHEAEIEDYEGHPLINALPVILSPEETANLLNCTPKVNEVEKTLPAHLRRHAIMRILDQFLYPTKTHLQLEQVISGMIRRGYLSRNIADASFQKTLDEANNLNLKPISQNAGNASLVSSVIGSSGTGKSTASEAILKSYPQVLFHPEYSHTQLVWLKLDSPHDGSVRHLCINFFRAVDQVLGTDYEQLYVKSGVSPERMIGNIATVVAIHSLGLLVIDEVQHLSTSKSGGSEKILNFFVTLANVVKVPILFIGTPNAVELFSPTMRSARRMAQFGSINWNRFERSEYNKSTDWERFLKRLWRLQWFTNPTPLTEPIKNLFWDYTQGIPHIAVILFYLAQTRAITINREVLDNEIFEKVYHQELSIIHPMIKALQSGRKEEILKYTDLDIPTDRFRTAPHSQSEEVIINTTDSDSLQTDKLQQLTSILVQTGIGEDIANLVATQAIEEKPDENVLGLVAHIQNLRNRNPSNNMPKRTKPKPLKPTYVDGDLRLLNKESTEEELYHALKQQGMIVDITEYLPS